MTTRFTEDERDFLAGLIEGMKEVAEDDGEDTDHFDELLELLDKDPTRIAAGDLRDLRDQVADLDDEETPVGLIAKLDALLS